MGLKLDINNIRESAERQRNTVISGVALTAKMWAPKLEGIARARAPWTDRTGFARKTLTASMKKDAEGIWTITLSYGVYYGKYLETFVGSLPKEAPTSVTGLDLELMQEKKWATIIPTIRDNAPKIVEDLKEMTAPTTLTRWGIEKH